MIWKRLVAIVISLASLSCAAQVVPDVYRPTLATSAGMGLSYWSGDWGSGDINRLGPSAWATVSIWHDLSVIAESHTMVASGNKYAQNFKYVAGGAGLIYTSGYYGRFQPFFKGEIGYGSLTHPDNGTGHLHHSSHIWTAGGGVEYHTWGNMWTHVEYTYDFFPNFHSSITNQNHTLNPRGFTFGETFRFGPSGSQF